MYRSGTDLLLRQSQSLFIVTSGLVKVTYTDPFKDLQEYFLASGRVVLLCIAPKPEGVFFHTHNQPDHAFDKSDIYICTADAFDFGQASLGFQMTVPAPKYKFCILSLC